MWHRKRTDGVGADGEVEGKNQVVGEGWEVLPPTRAKRKSGFLGNLVLLEGVIPLEEMEAPRLAKGSQPFHSKFQGFTRGCHSRHRKNQDAAQQFLGRLRDNREQQHFLQDCHEVRLPGAPGYSLAISFPP